MASIIFLACSFAILSALAIGLWRYPAPFALLSVGIIGILDCLQVWASGMSLGIYIYLDDMGCVVLIAAAVILAARTGQLPFTFCWPLLILLCLAILNFTRGVALYGVKPAGNGVRDLVYLILPIVAISAMQTTRISLSRIALWLCVLSWMLIVVGVLRWSGSLPIPEEVLGADEIRGVIRVLPADYAMIIGQALIALLAMQLIRGVRATGVLTAAFFCAILLSLQHRSVWIATSIGIVWFVFRSWSYAGRQLTHLAAIALGCVLFGSVVLVATGNTDKVISLVTVNVNETHQEDSTWAWRVNGFSEAIERSLTNGVLETAIGPPAGRDLEDIASDAAVHIHSRYVGAFAFYGVIGVALLMTWLWILAARLRRCASLARFQLDGAIEAVLFEAVLISELTYFIAYSGGLLHGALLGVLWLAAGTKYEEYNQETIPTSRQSEAFEILGK
jgi:hypothetical protein